MNYKIKPPLPKGIEDTPEVRAKLQAYVNGERPVSPATTAREWLIERLGVTGALGLAYQMLNGERVAEILEAREKSQSEKLVGIGQEAAERIDQYTRTLGWNLPHHVKEFAAIIDSLVAERLAK